MSSGIITTPTAAATGDQPRAVPDLGDVDETAAVYAPASSGRLNYSNTPTGFLVLVKLGSRPQGDVYWVSGATARLTALNGRGIVVTPPQGNVGAPLRAILSAAGVKAIIRQSDSAEVGLWPPIVIAGQDPLQEGLGVPFDPDETYLEGEL